MFVGRETLLEQLSHSLLSGSASKCVVMFGQKRAGKSSILEHLRRRLLGIEVCLPIQFSLYEIGPNLNEAAFFYQIIRSVSEAVVNSREHIAANADLSYPSLDDLREHPALRFHEAMSSLTRELRRASGNKGFDSRTTDR
jgi:AAA+ ATPase superfamily predicted ATPase